MRPFKYFFLTITILFLHSQVKAHGFGANTQIKTYDSDVARYRRFENQGLECWQSIRQIYEYTMAKTLKAKSYDLQTGRWVFQPVEKVGISETNCYIRIRVDQSIINVIECTPSQEFYEVNLQCWLPACQLHTGNHLLRDGSDGNGSSIEVVDVELVAQPLSVYMIEVANYHTFVVTSLNIATHNMILEPTLLYVGEAAFANSLSCGAAGSTFGPIGTFAGVAIGALITVDASYCFGDWDRVWYKLKYDIRQVTKVFNEVKVYFRDGTEKQERHKQSVGESWGGGGSGDHNDDSDKQDKKNDVKHTTNKQDKTDAEKLGYKQAKNPPFKTHGKLAFKKGNRWISADRTSHNGGRWKLFDLDGNRLGTCDALLRIIGE